MTSTTVTSGSFDLLSTREFARRTVLWTKVPTAGGPVLVVEVAERKTAVGPVARSRRYLVRADGGRLSFKKPRSVGGDGDRYWWDREMGCGCWGFLAHDRCLHAEAAPGLLKVLEG